MKNYEKTCSTGLDVQIVRTVGIKNFEKTCLLLATSWSSPSPILLFIMLLTNELSKLH